MINFQELSDYYPPTLAAAAAANGARMHSTTLPPSIKPALAGVSGVTSSLSLSTSYHHPSPSIKPALAGVSGKASSSSPSQAHRTFKRRLISWNNFTKTFHKVVWSPPSSSTLWTLWRSEAPQDEVPAVRPSGFLPGWLWSMINMITTMMMPQDCHQWEWYILIITISYQSWRLGWFTRSLSGNKVQFKPLLPLF